MNPATLLKKVEDAGFSLSLDGADIIVSSNDELNLDQRDFIRDHKTEIVEALRARELEASGAGSDLLPANTDRLLVTVYTPAGLPMLVEADSPAHAEWLVRANPPPVDGAPTSSKPHPHPISGEIRNPGLPADLFVLAIRYCSEAHGDGQGAIEEMMVDLQAVPDDWDWWRQYFMEKLEIPSEVQCSNCEHCEATSGNLGRCRRGIHGPGASSLWWMSDRHPCIQYSAIKEAA